MQIEALLHFLAERVAIQHKKDADEPRPWTQDQILNEGKFCHVERERDRTTVWIRENWRSPHCDNPDLWFAICVARRINQWQTLAELEFPVPWDAERFLAVMQAREARGEACYNSSAYRLLPGCPQGMPLTEFLGQQMFPMLWGQRDHLRPRAGETLRAFCERLRHVHGWGPFLAAQVAADLKYATPLKNAKDWMTFAVSGPGSQRGLNRICGRPVDARWVESDWYRKICELRALIAPELERLGLGDLHLQDSQNLVCEYDKLERWRAEGIPPAKRYRPAGTKPTRQTRRPPTSRPAPQITNTPPASDWQRPTELPDLRRVGVVALDLETKDGGLLAGKGSGWPHGDGHICGVSVAYHADGGIRASYFPLQHPDSTNFDREQVFQWLKDHVDSDVHFVTQNGGYDWGWSRAEAGIKMPPSERLEEIGALATLIDENRYQYSLDALCKWRGLPGKNEALLKEAAAFYGLPNHTKVQAHLWQLPARFVGPYAEADASNTLALFESLDPVLDTEGTRDAYRLECDLLPMVLEMRLRGVRIDTAAAERARDLLVQKRDTTLAELSDKLGARVDIADIGRTRWLAETFDSHGISYPLTEKGAPSFTAGSTGWMHKHPHWLPQLIVKADKAHNAAVKFLENYILGHAVNGRIHAEVHPHRSDEGGTRSLRFSYSNPPLQQMTAHDEELAPLIRGVFLPEQGEVWAKPDISQQEFRFIVHYAARHKLHKAAEAVERYRNDSSTDFHALVAEWTGIDRQAAKTANFAKIYGAGVRRFAAQVGMPESKARAIFNHYDRELPFVSQLAHLCERAARRQGFLTLYDGARRHWDNWAPGGPWEKGAGPCPRDEAERRVLDAEHPWYRKQLWRTDTRLAFNALIQGSAARHTKLWMRACWREGIVPLLQMHDCLDCSVASPEQAERVAQLGREAVMLEVPIQVDLKFGRTWGDAKHTWEELTGAAPKPAPKSLAPPPAPPEPKVAAPINGAQVCAAPAKAPIILPPAQTPRERGKICCPFHDDRTPSCQLYPDGHYHCFGCGAHGWIDELDGTGEDVLAELAAHGQDDDTRTLKRALELWEDGNPIPGTLAERYLADARKIDLAGLPTDTDAVLRFHPRCPFGPGTRHPCLLALFRDVELDTPAGIHRVALTPEAKKIDRRTLGRWPGVRAIKLWPAASELVIGEGIETVLAAATRCTHRDAPLRPAWAMGPKSGITNLPILDGVQALAVLVDNDSGAPAIAKACATRWTAAGRTVRLLTTQHVKDFNDLVIKTP